MGLLNLKNIGSLFKKSGFIGLAILICASLVYAAKYQPGIFITDQLKVDNLDLNGNTFSSTNTNGNIVFDPNGSGLIDIQSNLSLTGLLFGPNGSGTEPTYSFSNDTNLGMYRIGSDDLGFVAGGTKASLSSEGLTVDLDGTITPNSKLAFEVTGTTTKASKPAPTLNDTQRDAISSPTAGSLIYSSTSNAYEFYDGVSWETVGSGGEGGSGLKNYLTSADALFEFGTGTWGIYKDTGAFVDGTGGTPGGNLAISGTTTIGEYLEGTQSLKIAKTGSCQHEGVSVLTKVLDRQDYGRVLHGSIEFDATGANMVAGDFRLYAYDVTNGAILPLIADNNADIPALKGKIDFQVQTQTTTERVRLAIHVMDSGSNSKNLFVDDVKLGPSATVPTAIVTPWVSYTPTATWIANSTWTGRWRRVGDTLEFQAAVSLSGAPTAGNLFIDLPPGLTMDTNKMVNPATNEDSNLGRLAISDANAVDWVGILRYGTTTTLRAVYLDASANQQAVSSTAPATFASGDRVELWGAVPIVGWGATGSVSTTETLLSAMHVEVRKTSNQTFSTGSATTVTWEAAYEDKFGMFDDANDRINILKSGRYIITYQGRWASNTTGARAMYVVNSNSNVLSRNDVQAGGETHNNGSRVIWLNKGDYIQATASQASGGNLALQASGTLPQLNTYLSVTLIPDLTTFGVYGVGEVQEAQSSAFALTTSGFATGEYAQMSGNSVTLTPGLWKLDGNVYLAGAGSSAVTVLLAGWYAANGNNTSSAPTAISPAPVTQTFAINDYAGTSNARNSTQAPPITLSLSSTTTIYLNSLAAFSNAGTATMTANIVATRIK